MDVGDIATLNEHICRKSIARNYPVKCKGEMSKINDASLNNSEV